MRVNMEEGQYSDTLGSVTFAKNETFVDMVSLNILQRQIAF